MHQLSGAKRRVIGTFQLEIPVFREAELLDAEVVKLAVLKWIFARIPSDDPWRPVFERYLGEIADRVRGFGGDPDAVEPSVGDERPGELPGLEGALVGKVCAVHYDCFGDFVGFDLATCDDRRGFESRERAVERLVVRACDERLRLAVSPDPEDERRPLRITVVCC